MGALSRDLGSIAGRAFTWWVRELASFLPDIGGRAGGSSRVGTLVVTFDQGKLHAVPQGSSARSAGREPLQEDALLDHIAHLARNGRPVAVTLTLPEAVCLSRHVDVPDRARSEVGQILALDFERAMPFSSDDVYTAHFQDRSTSASPGATRFTQLVVKKSIVDPAISRLEAAGANVAVVDCSPQIGAGPWPVNFLETVRGADGKSKGRTRAVASLAALAAVLLSLAVWISISRREQALAQLELEAAQARNQVTAIEAQLGAATAAVNDVAAVTAIKSGRPPSVNIVDELTRLLPDDVFLNELRIDGDTLAISGFGKAASELVPVLERSTLFSGAALMAPVTFDERIGKERFSYGLKLKGHDAPPASGSKLREEQQNPVDSPGPIGPAEEPQP